MGLTRKGLADDLARMYGDWGDVISHNGSVIEGFVSIVENYDADGDTKDSMRIMELHSPKFMVKGDVVTANNVDYKIESREQLEKAFVYRLNR